MKGYFSVEMYRESTRAHAPGLLVVDSLDKMCLL